MNGGNNRCVTTIIIRHLSQVLLYKIGISRRNSYQKICSFIGIAVGSKILCKLQSDCYTVFIYSALGSVLYFVISMNILQDVRIGRSISVSLIFQVVSKFLPWVWYKIYHYAFENLSLQNRLGVQNMMND